MHNKQKKKKCNLVLYFSLLFNTFNLISHKYRNRRTFNIFVLKYAQRFPAFASILIVSSRMVDKPLTMSSRSAPVLYVYREVRSKTARHYAQNNTPRIFYNRMETLWTTLLPLELNASDLAEVNACNRCSLVMGAKTIYTQHECAKYKRTTESSKCNRLIYLSWLHSCAFPYTWHSHSHIHVYKEHDLQHIQNQIVQNGIKHRPKANRNITQSNYGNNERPHPSYFVSFNSSNASVSWFGRFSLLIFANVLHGHFFTASPMEWSARAPLQRGSTLFKRSKQRQPDCIYSEMRGGHHSHSAIVRHIRWPHITLRTPFIPNRYILYIVAQMQQIPDHENDVDFFFYCVYCRRWRTCIYRNWSKRCPLPSP